MSENSEQNKHELSSFFGTYISMLRRILFTDVIRYTSSCLPEISSVGRNRVLERT